MHSSQSIWSNGRLLSTPQYPFANFVEKFKSMNDSRVEARAIDITILKHARYLRFWGKQRGAVEGGATWHAAAYHCF